MTEVYAVLAWYFFGVFATALVMIGLHLTARIKITPVMEESIVRAAIAWPSMLIALALYVVIAAAKAIERKITPSK